MILKYPKTPANIMMRGIDYLPTNVIRGVIQATRPLRGKVFDQREFVNSVSKGITGSALILVGYALYKVGAITGARDRDKDVADLKDEVGMGQYRINVSALSRMITNGSPKTHQGDRFESYDWAQPTSILIGIGANIAQNKGNETDVLTSVADAAVSGMNTLFEQPLLQGVQQLTGGYNNMPENIAKIAKGTPSSFIPTGLNQLRQMADPLQRDTGKSVLKQVQNKIPGQSQILKPRVNTLGQEKRVFKDDYNALVKMFDAFIKPSYGGKYKTTPGIDMVFDIYSKTGLKTHFPRVVDTINYKGKALDLTDEEKTYLQKTVGERTIKMLDSMAVTYSKNSSQKDAETKASEISKNVDKIVEDVRKKIRQERGLW
jgi:hypothetical protein